jgi:hypothetical protein
MQAYGRNQHLSEPGLGGVVSKYLRIMQKLSD